MSFFLFIQKLLSGGMGVLKKLKRPRTKRFRISLLTTGIVLILFALWKTQFSAPVDFPSQKIVSISSGTGLSEIAAILEEEHIIRSATWLAFLVTLSGKQSTVVAGDYFFDAPRGVFAIARIVTKGDFGLDSIRTSLVEGSSRENMAETLDQLFPSFNRELFLYITRNDEGYLFPDTYYFFPNVSEQQIAQTLRSTFEEKIAELAEDLDESPRTLEEIVTMASIIERETRTKESRRIVSGILWKRLDNDIPLQVDVTFDYINGKNTFTLTREDLNIDSPYNTYRYRGLPPGPIANPGLDSLKAALNPTETPYLYFLADKKGVTHYSRTFEEHKRKKALYLN